MRTTRVIVCLVALGLASCGGGSGGGGGGGGAADPAGATELAEYLRTEILNVLLAAGRINEALPNQTDPILLNAAGRGATGIAVQPDLSPAAIQTVAIEPVPVSQDCR